ncbi:hypothetical protein RF11_09986 [Thelohanellus kitauei]|uniref:Uncharacterized protein n=1 Tax=Thelohanellus kitauei TaxID=669202 RepID=A0A0C2ME58_THEKT|nr:hypothetical protein RF11_09986 [Thelohanellus kitauei]
MQKMFVNKTQNQMCQAVNDKKSIIKHITYFIINLQSSIKIRQKAPCKILLLRLNCAHEQNRRQLLAKYRDSQILHFSSAIWEIGSQSARFSLYETNGTLAIVKNEYDLIKVVL